MTRFFIIALSLLFVPQAVWAADALMITPTRIVIDGREREAKVTLTNTGDETGEYRLFFVNYRMTESGDFVAVTEPTGPFADKLIRYSPKQVQLPPGTTQTARLVLRKPAGLADGEYRSHLVFQSVPKQAPVEQITPQKGRASAKFTTLYGVSIPVIVRSGKTSAKVTLDAPQLVEENGKRWLTVRIEREGNRSVYGDLKVVTGTGKDEKTVGESNGVGVYTDITTRIARIPLEAPIDPAATYHLTFRDPSDGTLMAEKDFKLR